MSFEEISTEVNNCGGGFNHWNPLISLIVFNSPAVFSVPFIDEYIMDLMPMHSSTNAVFSLFFRFFVVVVHNVRIFLCQFIFHTDHQSIIISQIAFILKKEKRCLSSMNMVWMYKNAQTLTAGGMCSESHSDKSRSSKGEGTSQYWETLKNILKNKKTNQFTAG